MAIGDLWALAGAALAGMLLGAAFFGGLWWTVQRCVGSRYPAVWIFGSLWLRTGIALLGFHLVAAGRWERLLASLAGFALARAVVSRRVPPGPEARRAP